MTSHMIWTDTSGAPMRYGDSQKTPVPRKTYRCKSTLKKIREQHSTYTHGCKLVIDHDGDHRCICGRTWQPLGEGQ